MRNFICSLVIILLCMGVYSLPQQQQNPHHRRQQQPMQQPQTIYINRFGNLDHYIVQSVFTLEPKCEPGYVIVNHRCHKQT